MRNLRHFGSYWRNLLPLVLLILLIQSFASAQQPSASPAPIDYRKEWIRALDRAEDLDKKLKAAQETITQLEIERDTSQKLQAVTKAERESLERSIAIAERIMATQEKAIAIYEKAIETQAKIIDKQGARVGELETRLDKANARVVKAGVFGFLGGVAAAVIKIF